MDAKDRNILGATVRGGGPLKSYKKTILGKVFVNVWNSFENIAEGVILQGDPKNNDDECIIDVFTPDEDYYFRNKNKLHLQTGTVVEFVRKEETKEKTIEQFNDEELEAVLEDKFKKFFGLQTLVNSTESVPLLLRIKAVAERKEKSAKIIGLLEARISELQQLEYSPIPDVMETEL